MDEFSRDMNDVRGRSAFTVLGHVGGAWNTVLCCAVGLCTDVTGEISINRCGPWVGEGLGGYNLLTVGDIFGNL